MTTVNLTMALKALLDWGREHTSPTDKNSPHALLVAADAALKAAPPPWEDDAQREKMLAALPNEKRTASALTALEVAEVFIRGFEGDEMQEGIAGMLAKIGEAKALLSGEKPALPSDDLGCDLCADTEASLDAKHLCAKCAEGAAESPVRAAMPWRRWWVRVGYTETCYVERDVLVIARNDTEAEHKALRREEIDSGDDHCQEVQGCEVQGLCEREPEDDGEATAEWIKRDPLIKAA